MTWAFSTRPQVPVCWRCTPTILAPFLWSPVLSMTSTPIGLAELLDYVVADVVAHGVLVPERARPTVGPRLAQEGRRSNRRPSRRGLSRIPVMAEHAEGSVEVAATPQAVMAVVADFDAYPEWVGNLEQVEVLARDRRGRGTRVAFRLRTPVLSAAYTLAYRYAPRQGGLSWEYVEGTLEDLSGSYTLEPTADGGTLVTYRLQVELGMPLPGLVKRQAARQIVRSALGDLKRRVESE
jgi:ribosome-associated toxin RatA of RatAB toxin-antitoxin module